MVTTVELQQVIRLLLKKSQMERFALAYQALASGNPMATSDHLNKLSPFIDDQILMRLRRLDPSTNVLFGEKNRAGIVGASHQKEEKLDLEHAWWLRNKNLNSSKLR